MSDLPASWLRVRSGQLVGKHLRLVFGENLAAQGSDRPYYSLQDILTTVNRMVEDITWEIMAMRYADSA